MNFGLSGHAINQHFAYCSMFIRDYLSYEKSSGNGTCVHSAFTEVLITMLGIKVLISLANVLSVVICLRDHYIAAVYEHGGQVAIPNNTTYNRSEALKIMNPNLDVLAAQAEIASKQVCNVDVRHCS